MTRCAHPRARALRAAAMQLRGRGRGWSACAAQWKTAQPAGVVGADPDEAQGPQPTTKSAKKNAARRAKAAAVRTDGVEGGAADPARGEGAPKAPLDDGASGADPGAAMDLPEAAAAEVGRHVKALAKKLRQVDDLAARQADGAELNEEQRAKVGRRDSIAKDLERWQALAAGGFDPAKRAKNLRKKVRQAEDLEGRAAMGAELNDEQRAKVAGKAQLEAEIEELAQIFGEAIISAGAGGA